MKERPILFSGPMVRAIMRAVDPKTNTRRVVRFPKNAVHSDRPLALTWQQRMEGYRELGAGGVSAAPLLVGPEFGGQRLYCSVANDDGIAELRCPYGEPGDRLWVRESWRHGFPPSQSSAGIIYRADAPRAVGMDEYSDRHRWKRSIHMPRWASRITLQLTDVRVERVQDISEADAIAEGCSGVGGTHFDECESPSDEFRRLWDSLNAKRGHSWGMNPWVWVLTFRRLEAGT